MILTQLIWLRPGGRPQFDAFEDAVLPLLPNHGGELLLRLRDPAAAVGAALQDRPPPDEVHVLRFRDDAALQSFLSDPIRQAALPLKDASVELAILL